MKQSVALEKEKDRKEESRWNVILLSKDGSFYRAYEWSAWLIKTVVCTEEYQKQRGDDKMLVVKRYITKNSDYAMIGFPIDSISKYVPEYDTMDTNDGDITITISLPFDGKNTYEQMQMAFDEWKQHLEINENKSNKSTKDITCGSTMSIGRSGLFHIVSQILSYPLERKTPSDNYEFISNIKQQVAGLL